MSNVAYHNDMSKINTELLSVTAHCRNRTKAEIKSYAGKNFHEDGLTKKYNTECYLNQTGVDYTIYFENSKCIKVTNAIVTVS